MKRALLGLLAVMMLVMSACGDATIAVVVPLVEPPSITLSDIYIDGGREVVGGIVNFFAPDSDIDTMTVAVFDSRGELISRTTTLIDLPGVIQGTIPFSIGYGNRDFLIDTLTLSVYLTDFNGFTSNVVVSTFLVP